MRTRKPLIDRFMAKVSPEPNSGCWLWTAYADKDGYGQFTKQPFETEDGKAQSGPAHRLSWELHCGPIPDGKQVCHRCDVPSCINPGHLWLGTNKDNMHDKKIKGRAPKGNENGNAYLTDAAVRAIRAAEFTHEGIAKVYGTSKANVSLIRARKTWTHLQQGETL